MCILFSFSFILCNADIYIIYSVFIFSFIFLNTLSLHLPAYSLPACGIIIPHKLLKYDSYISFSYAYKLVSNTDRKK